MKSFSIKYTNFFFKKNNYKIFQYGKEGKRYFDLFFKDKENRFIYNLRDIYILILFSPKFFLNLFYYRSFKLSYFKTLFSILKVKTVITWLDNNGTYQELDKKFKDIKFFTFQNGFRSHLCLTEKKIYHSNFICFGKNDVDRYKKYGHEVKNFLPYGSLKLNLVLDNKFNINILNDKRKDFTITIIDELPDPYIVNRNYTFENNDQKRLSPSHRTKGTLLMLEYIKKYSNEQGIIPQVLLRYPKEETVMSSKLEKIYLEIFKNKIDLIFNDEMRIKSYLAGLKADLLLGLKSTLLCELFSCGKKILSLNYTNDPKFSFPIEGMYNYNGKPNYQSFKNKVEEIKNIPIDKWLATTHKERDYINKITKINEYKILF